MAIIFVWFIWMQILGPNEQVFDQSGHSIIYNGTFTWEKSDGTKQNISVPGRYKIPAKQTMVITTTLPDDYNENVIAKGIQCKKSSPIWQKLCQPLCILQYFICRCQKSTSYRTYNIYK